jgi:hypothetical protein
MKYLIICICLLTLILGINASCRTNCKTCQIINTLNENISVCIKCNNKNWGDSCQNECNCKYGCDIDNGDCIIMTKNVNIEVNSIGYTFLFIIGLCIFCFVLYKLGQCIQQRCQRKVHIIV